MKRILTFSILSFLLIACNSNDNIPVDEDLSSGIDAITQEEKTDIVEYTPKPKLSYSTIKKSSKNSERSDAELEVLFSIDEVVISKFKDFGEGVSDEDGLYLASDISQKSYLIEIISSEQILLRYVIYFEGEQDEVWVRTYVRKNEQWKQSKCTGECN